MLAVLSYAWDDWAIPWAGIAAALAGTGSLLSGYAALKTARSRAKRDELAERDELARRREGAGHGEAVEGGGAPSD